MSISIHFGRRRRKFIKYVQLKIEVGQRDLIKRKNKFMAIDNNVKFNYLYRDAGNYKLFDPLIFTNKNSLSLEYIESTIRKNLIEGMYFVPEKWNVLRLSFENYSPALDHDYHEFESIEFTGENPTEIDDISTFILSFTK